MKVFSAVTLVVFLCCLEVVLSYPRPAAMSEGPDGVAGDRPQQHCKQPSSFMQNPLVSSKSC